MKRSLMALALAAALPVSAQAAELSYNFIELDYARMNIDGVGGDFDPDGFGLKGSFELGEKMYAFGSYLRGSDDVSGIDIDVDQTQLGLGYRHGVSDTADFIAELSWINQSVDAGSFGGADGNGGRLSAGFRGVMAENFEGYAKANYTDGGDFDGDFSGTLGAQVKFNPTWGVTGEAEFGSDANIYMIGLRASF
ncbi:MAG: outer membrane beta-barrel protein [Alphaproteobacteria bacterium]